MQTTSQRVAKLRRSIALQNRVKSNLEQMQFADAGLTIALSERIIELLQAQIAIYLGSSDGRVIA